MMRTTLKTLSLALLCGVAAVAGGVAQAASLGTPVGNDVPMTVTLYNADGTVAYELASGDAAYKELVTDAAANIGNNLGGGDIYASYRPGHVTSAAAKQYGGDVWSLNISAENAAAILEAGTKLPGGETINQVRWQMGVGGGGVAFEGISDPSKIFINTSTTTSAEIGLDVGPWPYTYVGSQIKQSSAYRGFDLNTMINSDGTVGIDVLFDAEELQFQTTDFDVLAELGGDMVAPYTEGLSNRTTGVDWLRLAYSIRVETIPEPSTVALVSMACIGGVLYFRRRRA